MRGQFLRLLDSNACLRQLNINYLCPLRSGWVDTPDYAVLGFQNPTHAAQDSLATPHADDWRLLFGLALHYPPDELDVRLVLDGGINFLPAGGSIMTLCSDS